MMPQFVAPGGYWMLSQGRQDAHSAMDKSIVFMTNYSAAARAYPDFVIPAAGTAANATGSAKKALGELKGALAVLKRNLTGYQKSLATVLGNIAQQRDLPFQEKWKGAMHDVITSLQRHRNFLAGIGAASQFCPKTTEFIKDFQLTGENYTRLLGKAMAALPPPQPMGNGIGFNPLALEAKREMYNVSKIMMERLVGQVNRLIPEYLNATKACEWGPAPNATASSEAGAPVPPPVLQQPATTQPPQKPRSAKKKTPWPDVAPDSTADPQQDQAGQPAQQEAQPQQPPQPQQQPQQQPQPKHQLSSQPPVQQRSAMAAPPATPRQPHVQPLQPETPRRQFLSPDRIASGCLGSTPGIQNLNGIHVTPLHLPAPPDCTGPSLTAPSLPGHMQHSFRGDTTPERNVNSAQALAPAKEREVQDTLQFTSLPFVMVEDDDD